MKKKSENPPPPLKKSDFSVSLQNFSSLTRSYLLKVTEFLVKISQFEFLVMTEKNIFAYKLFLSLNISDFNFLCENCNSSWKKSPPLFPSYPPLKVEVLSSPPSFWKFGWRFNSPSRIWTRSRTLYGLWLYEAITWSHKTSIYVSNTLATMRFR